MTQQLAPEVLALLKTVLKDNDSAFRRIAGMRAKGIFDGPLPWREPSLSKEERYLVGWHREEVARLLYEGCMLTLQGPTSATKTILQRREVEEQSWKRRCRQVLRSEREEWPSEREELEIGIAQGQLGAAAARLSYALEPTEDTRYALAELLLIEGDPEESRKVAEQIIQTSPLSGHRSAAYTVLGTIAHEQGDHAASLEQYRNATETSRHMPPAYLSWLVQAAILGDKEQALEAMRRVRENLHIVRRVLDPYTEALPGLLSPETCDRLRSDHARKRILLELRRNAVEDAETRILNVLL
ncbi:MAG TPA: hypothetical protein ENJ09_00200 [Planctomycetes bacterium]|nr:hypothetical protein [Planctomycetota bacterium]